MAVLCRNHRGFVETTLAASLLGADVLYLNTAFSGPAAGRAAGAGAAAAAGARRGVRRAARGGDRDTTGCGLARRSATPTAPSCAAAPADGCRTRPTGDPPGVLTSGTTGSPKGAPRSRGRAGGRRGHARPDPAPRRAAPPTSRPRCSTPGASRTWRWRCCWRRRVVLRRHFDPEDCLRTVPSTTRCEALAVSRSCSSACCAARRGARRTRPASPERSSPRPARRCPATWPLRWMDRFGDHALQPLRLDRGGLRRHRHARVTCAPRRTTAGRPPYGTDVRILDDAGERGPRRRSRGASSSATASSVEGYTGGGSKEVVDGLMATGDVGHVDARGRLFVEGRDDDMIVSGGENVFPSEVEDCLATVTLASWTSRSSECPTRTSGSGCAPFVVGSSDRRAREEEDAARLGARPAGPLQRAPRAWSSSTSCPATPPARCCKRDLALIGTRPGLVEGPAGCSP